jgi:hypothetical protein
MATMNRTLFLFLVLPAAVALAPLPALAQEGPQAEAPEPTRIRDNLFLLEEAYNQEPGVIQHISVFQYAPEDQDWTYSFTEEWPVPTDLNQLSVTLNLSGTGEDGGPKLADSLINYRIQAVGLGGQGWLAVAPRVSLVLPVGDPDEGTGRGVIGLQTNLPISAELGRYFVAHLNAGATVTPGAQSPSGRTDTAVDANAGVALVWQPLSWLNPLVEFAYTVTEDIGDTSSEHADALVVNPGVRVAIDHAKSGLQIVPGLSVPMQVLPSDDFAAAGLAYVSFEHPAF